MDTFVRDSQGRDKLLEESKARLQWFLNEATEEEFDEEAVDLLINLIRKLEPDPQDTPEETQKALERFRAYVEFYQDNASTDKVTETSTDRNSGRTFGKICRFPKKGFFIAAAACLVLLLVSTYSLGEVNADENTGFFHWLKRDKEGVFAVTSPEEGKVGMGYDTAIEYDNVEELPQEYRGYVSEIENISSLATYKNEKVTSVKTSAFHVITELLSNPQSGEMVRIGVLIYPDKTLMLREKFNDYEYSYTNTMGEYEQDVYQKEDAGEVEYMVMFYKDNIKYFVAGQESLDFLEKVSEEYTELIFDMELTE